MPMAIVCNLNGSAVDVDEAVNLRDEARRAGQTDPDFRCVECGKVVRPHRIGRTTAAHFEHPDRNADCSLSNRART